MLMKLIFGYWIYPATKNWSTWAVGQEAAGVELQLLHEADLAVVTETVEIPLRKDKDGGGRVREGRNREVEGLFSQDQRPVGLQKTHTRTHAYLFYLYNPLYNKAEFAVIINFISVMFDPIDSKLLAQSGGTHVQPLASSLGGQVRILSTLSFCSHSQSLIPENQRDRQLLTCHAMDHIQACVRVELITACSSLCCKTFPRLTHKCTGS